MQLVTRSSLPLCLMRTPTMRGEKLSASVLRGTNSSDYDERLEPFPGHPFTYIYIYIERESQGKLR